MVEELCHSILSTSMAGGDIYIYFENIIFFTRFPTTITGYPVQASTIGFGSLYYYFLHQELFTI